MDCMAYHQGLLLMCDIQGLPSHQMSCGQLASGIWTLKYCVLYQQKLSMLGPALMHSICQNASKRWQDSDREDPATEYLNQFDTQDVFPERRINPQGNEGELLTQDELNTFLQKKINPAMRRSKPVKFNGGKEGSSSSLHPSSSSSRLGHGQVPFCMPDIESPDQIDLSSCSSEFFDAVVRPLHHSILGREHCFEDSLKVIDSEPLEIGLKGSIVLQELKPELQKKKFHQDLRFPQVIASDGSRCFACESAGERQSWIEKIKRAIKPNLDNSRRSEHQLILFVQEAKGLPSKKKYFCEICLDRKLFARTTSKWKNESGIFWAEHFEFTPTPAIQDVTIHLYKDSDKKKKKDKDYMGLVNLSIHTLHNQQSVEKWYTLSTPSGNNKNKAGEVMALRIKARFVSTNVLPTEMYKRFAEHVSTNYLNINHALNNIISVGRKDEVARILVNIMYGTGCITKFMTEIVMDEVAKVEEESLIFRENTIATKSVEALLRLVGMKYLHDILGDFIDALFNMEEECEVDGSRLPPHASLETNQRNLLMSCEIALCKIVNSTKSFPGELREVMSAWRIQCEAADRPRIASRLVTASLFLRLLCPAIFNPSLFGLAKEVPDARVSRTLTLIAKVIQNLANRTRFGTKEEYMQFMDAFVREKWDDMGTFIGNVSDPSIPSLPKGFQGYIDLGKEFAKLHAFFVEVLPSLDKKTIESLGQLPSLLDEISELLDKPQNPVLASSSRQKKDVSVSSEAMFQAESLPVSSSLMDLRRVRHMSSDVGRLPGSEPDFSHLHKPIQHSQPSLALCSQNNSNNNLTRQPSPDVLTPTENLPQVPPFAPPSTSEPQPLMFRNPAYKLSDRHRSSRTSLSQLHDSLNLQNSSMLRNFKPEKQVTDASKPNDNHQVSRGSPLSFANPLQGLSSSQHLETMFAAETVTYARPEDPAVMTPLRTEPSIHSNQSSLSTRESSTTTTSRSSHEDILGHQTALHKSASFPNPTPHKTAKDSSWGGLVAPNDEQFLVPAQTVSRAVSSAHLKTGLQTSNQQRKSEIPQPKPRKNAVHSGSDQIVSGRKYSVPSVASNISKPTARRCSSGNVRTAALSDESTAKYPKFELAKIDQDAVLKLGEAESHRMVQRHPAWKDDFAKLDDGMVAAPVAAVKSRVVVATANANRVKTSQHSPLSGPKQKAQHSVNSGQMSRRTVGHRSANKPTSPSDHQSDFPPATPESQLSPEARTAQWVLNHDPHPHHEEEAKEDARAIMAKNYEERMLRMETEILGLRTRLKNENDARSRAEKREAVLSDKLRSFEKRESKFRKQIQKERDAQIQTLLQRMSILEGDIVRQREEYAEERQKLQNEIQNKDELLMRQQAKVDELKMKLASFEQGSNEQSKNTASNICPRGT